MDDEALALALQPRLKPKRGFAPKVPHICAAILMARDSTLSSREACRRVPGVPQSARDRVAELAVRVRPLLAEFEGANAADVRPQAPLPPRAPGQQHRSPAASIPPASLAALQRAVQQAGLELANVCTGDELLEDLGLPPGPLRPVPVDAARVSPPLDSPPPPDAAVDDAPLPPAARVMPHWTCMI